ncbi:myeloid-associated differentiation marker-like [Salarias fasciatus]|uniref:myeloid-associated differentiation marker-like n=1 Tax=Salarias fasciatus TaxID=181472 RepID=UPI001176B95A|nr:myeloid-associated differentiation marker-like [Salarias fasciatus]
MLRVDLRALTQPVGVMRLMETVVTLMCVVLVATVGHVASSYWAWCMFTWCFCFFFTLLILVLEFTTVSDKLPFAWEDFTTAFAMLASLMCLSASIIYPSFFTCATCSRQIGASVVSWVCFGLYVGEVVFTRLRPRGEIIGFLSTLPGILKMLETFLACLIFISLETGQYSGSPETQWCVAVYSLCFIFAIIIILVTLGQLTSGLPFPFERVVIVYNILSAVMYATAMVIWPLYSFQKRIPAGCVDICHDKLVMVTVMTVFNFLVYAVDSGYSIYLVFFKHTF